MLAFSHLASALSCGHATHKSSPKPGGGGGQGVAFSAEVQNPSSPLCSWIDTACHLQLQVLNRLTVIMADIWTQAYMLHTHCLLQRHSLTCRCREQRTNYPHFSPAARKGRAQGMWSLSLGCSPSHCVLYLAKMCVLYLVKMCLRVVEVLTRSQVICMYLKATGLISSLLSPFSPFPLPCALCIYSEVPTSHWIKKVTPS